MSARRAAGAALTFAMAGAASCDLPVLSPPTDERATVRFQVEEQGDTSVARVLGKVDRARLTITGSDYSAEGEVPAIVHEGTVLIRFVLSPPVGPGTLTMRAELRAGGHGLFEGTGTLTRTGEDVILLRPIAERLDPVFPPFQIDALGDTIALSADAVFSTGDVWRSARPTWTSLDPAVLEVIPGDGAVTRSNGIARLRVAYEDLSLQWLIRVAQVPTELWGVAPADTTIAVGDSFPLRVFGEDENGFALLPGARVSWIVGGGVVVDTLGVVTATEAGPAFARPEGTQHTATLTVGSPPGS